MSASYKELLGIDGEPIEFEWNILPGFSTLQIFQRIQNDLQERNIEPEKFTCRIIFMSMFDDIDLRNEFEFRIENVNENAKRLSQGHWTFLGLGDEKKGTIHYTFEGK